MNEKIKDIAVRIKGLRLFSDASQADVAKAVGLSLEDFQKFEDGQDDIPVSILYELADYYKVDMTEILTGVSPKLHDVCFVRKSEGLRVERYDQYEFQSLAYKYANRNIEPLYVVLNPSKTPECVVHKGQEFNYCLEGRMKVIIGNDEYVLEPGDSLYFNSMHPHKMVPLDEKEAKFLTIISI